MEAQEPLLNHVSVLRSETVDSLLNGRTHGTFVDATFGRGGHTQALLDRLDQTGRVIAFDKDPDAQTVGHQLARHDPRLTMVHASFAELTQELARLGITQVDGIMADLGVSSPQLDDAERGFSFMHDGPLDMRMDSTRGPTAAQWLARISEQDLANALYQYGEERYSRRLASAIVHARSQGPITRTGQLAELVKTAHPRWEKNKHPATRSFQAIRIAVNRELEDLEHFLEQSLEVLAPQGRLTMISFHSLEDRRVKQFIQKQSQAPENSFEPFLPRLKKVARIAPSDDEVKANPRARSAWLRVAERTAHAYTAPHR